MPIAMASRIAETASSAVFGKASATIWLDRPAGEDILAEIAEGRAAEELSETGRERQVEAHLGVEGGDGFRRRPGAEQDHVAGSPGMSKVSDSSKATAPTTATAAAISLKTRWRRMGP